MKKYIIYLLIIVPFVLNAQQTYVPDDGFEQALISLGYDTPPRNDSVPTKNIDTITNLTVSERNIKDLTGIVDFKALTRLYCNRNALTSLDVSKNTALTLLSCHRNTLTSLEVSKNTALAQLICFKNALTSLDVSKNIALKVLYCTDNALTSLDVSKNTALEWLACHGNDLTSLDVSNNAALTLLDCSANALTSLDVSKNTALDTLACWINRLTSLDVSKNTALERLDCYNNNLTSLDVSNNTALIWLDCNSNALTSFDISKNTALGVLDCTYHPYLYCIQVADSTKAAMNTLLVKDKHAVWSEDCGYTSNYETSNTESIRISPNPASDYIDILYENVILSGAKDLKIYNSIGECVINLTPALSEGDGVRIDVSQLSPGVYYLVIGANCYKLIIVR